MEDTWRAVRIEDTWNMLLYFLTDEDGLNGGNVVLQSGRGTADEFQVFDALNTPKLSSLEKITMRYT